MQDNSKIYEQRLKRYVTAMDNAQPDRVPVRLFAEEFASKYAGVNNQEAAADYGLAFDVTRKCASELGVDAAMSNGIVNWMGMSSMIGWKAVQFPGLGIPPHYVTQITEPDSEETAYLKCDEFEEFAEDPTRFLGEKWLPRFTSHIHCAGEPVTFRHNMSLISGSMAYLKYMSAFGEYGKLFKEAGVVNATAGTLKAPLDLIADKLRGYVLTCYDLYERRDLLIKACEAMMPHVLATALAGADRDENVPVTIWMHRGHTPYVAKRDFEEIYWPTLRPVIEEIYKAGHQVLLYAEGNWDDEMEAFRELPDKSVIFHVDGTDILKARDTLGGKFALSGGVQNDLLAFGTPEDVADRCRFILENVAGACGYIMDASMLIMDDAKIENVRTMVETTLEHGVFCASSAAGAGRKPQAAGREGGNPFMPQKRPAGTCIPFEEFVRDIPSLQGNIALMKKTWQDVDALGYSFLWTNLIW